MHFNHFDKESLLVAVQKLIININELTIMLMLLIMIIFHDELYYSTTEN